MKLCDDRAFYKEMAESKDIQDIGCVLEGVIFLTILPRKDTNSLPNPQKEV